MSNTTKDRIAEHGMEYRHLGKTGLKVSALSLGAWVTYGGQVGLETAKECMQAAYDAGVNFFDNAEGYAAGEAEVVMGKVVKELGWRRSDVVITTKIFFGARQNPGINDRGLSRKHIIEGMNESLERLQMDYVDVVFCHRPDPVTPIEETVRAMNYLLDHGKAFYWGTSEWSAQQITEAYAVARRLDLVPPQVEQPQYNMLHRTRFESEYASLYNDPVGMGTTIWSPLASGLLTGKYTRDSFPADSRLGGSAQADWLRESLKSGQGMNGLEMRDPERIYTIIDQLKPIAQELDASLAQLAIAWTLKNPNVSTVITGASRKQQVLENMKALPLSHKLTPEVMLKIEGVLKNKPQAVIEWRNL